MVEVTLADDKSVHADAVEDLIDRHREDFLPYGDYGGKAGEDSVDPAFFKNYQKPEEEMLVAEMDGELVGFMCFEPGCSRRDVPVEPAFTFISLTLVDAAHRDEGVGTALNEALLSLHDDGVIDDLLVRSTWESNDRQRHIYEKFGFEPAARKPEHRVNGEDTVYYARVV